MAFCLWVIRVSFIESIVKCVKAWVSIKLKVFSLYCFSRPISGKSQKKHLEILMKCKSSSSNLRSSRAFLTLSVEYLHSSAPILFQVGSRRHKAGEKAKHSHFSAFVLNSLTLLASNQSVSLRFWYLKAWFHVACSNS